MRDDYKDWQDYEVKVVMNHEKTISIWPVDKQNALGWTDVGVAGAKEECLEWIKKNCTPDCKFLGAVPVAV